MNWDLPYEVEVNKKIYKIRNQCDYRVVLDTIEALNDKSLTPQQNVGFALRIFYEDMIETKDLDVAIKEMYKIINNGEEPTKEEKPKAILMDWQHDFKHYIPPINRVLGYSVRQPDKYTHWYDFLGAYMEIGECVFSTIVSIRNKKLKGKKLEKWETEFYNEHRHEIDLPLRISDDEKEWLDSFD